MYTDFFMTAGDILFLIFESRLPAWLNNLSTAAEDIGAEKNIFEVFLVSVLSNIDNLIITASLLLNILWISTMPMDIHIHGKAALPPCIGSGGAGGAVAPLVEGENSQTY